MDLKKEAFIKAWETTFGNISQSCVLAEISRQTYYRWIADDEGFKAAIESIEPSELRMDFVENKLIEKINKGDTAVLIFVAKTLGKKRGYVERNEFTGADGAELIKGFIYATPNPDDNAK